MRLESLERHCRRFAARAGAADAAHDLSHVQRVVANTRLLTQQENANPRITLPAAWLHDCVAMAKDSPERHTGSRLAAAAAADFLQGLGVARDQVEAIAHAIEAHSFSAGIKPRTLEAGVVQDADRLDALGAIGIARCLLVGGRLNHPLFDPVDPFCDHREADDSRWTIDHFYAKVLKLPATMQTASGRKEAQRRAVVVNRFLEDLRSEMGHGLEPLQSGH